MNRRKNLIALDGHNGDEHADMTDDAADTMTETSVEEPAEEPQDVFEQDWDEEPALHRRNVLLPLVAVAAILGWTGFFGWAHQAEMLGGAAPATWAGWITDWAVPVLLVIGLWLLAMRNSTREANRFGETARLLSQESQALEARLTTVNRELSLAREFIASQSRDLESLGRVATERLSTNADRLQELIRDNGDQVNAIGHVSDSALSNMDRLRDQLPVISNAARDVANQIGNAGNTAQGQLDELVAGFARLNEFGEASATQVNTLGARIADLLENFNVRLDEMERQSDQRFNHLREKDEEFRLELEARETDTLAAIRRRSQELGSELEDLSAQSRAREEEAISEIQSRLHALRDEGLQLTRNLREGQSETESQWNASIESLKERMAEAIRQISELDEAAMGNARKRMDALRDAGRRVDESMTASTRAFDEEIVRRRAEAKAAEKAALDALEERIASFAARSSETQEKHLEHMASLAERGEALGQRLREFDSELSRLAEHNLEHGERLAQNSELITEKLSQSRAILEENSSFVSHLTDDCVRLLELIRSSASHSEGALSNAIGNAESRLAQFEVKAAALTDTMADAEAKGSSLSAYVTKAGEQSAEQVLLLESLQNQLALLAEQSSQVTAQARDELQQAIAALEEAATKTIADMQSGQAEAVRGIATSVGSEGAQAIEAAIRDAARETIAELEKSSALASERGKETTEELRREMARVSELASNLEQRVTRAREEAEEQVNNDFSRRMALITESLNSASIDIAKVFDAEVADTSWASYLRGDRGIFTRRAVRLLDNAETRSIAKLYEHDEELRDAVNHYIHDFEAMLRGVLSTRDGNAIAVTLLSSDIGKLYVALAQAIERLRN